MKKYSVLMYNFNNYEIMREPLEVDPDAEYIYVTDDPNLKSDNWNIVYDPDLDGLSPFDKCYAVRFNVFKYCNTDICVYLDGSIQIKKSLSPIVDKFIEGNYDLGIPLNIFCPFLVADYQYWVRYRNYPLEHARRALNYLQFHEKWDFNYRGYVECSFRIIKKNEANKLIDQTTYNHLKILHSNPIDRLDQPIYAYVLQSLKLDNFKVMPFGRQALQSDYMQKYQHNSTDLDIAENIDHITHAWLFNKPHEMIKI